MLTKIINIAIQRSEDISLHTPWLLPITLIISLIHKHWNSSNSL